jgi:hypothetical protein
MENQVGDVFRPGVKVSYDYDFGSTTRLAVKLVGEREGWVVKPNDVHLLARNDPPHIPCGRCHEGAATVIDMANSYDESGWLCARCAEETDLADSDMTLPVVNSPRTGVWLHRELTVPDTQERGSAVQIRAAGTGTRGTTGRRTEQST